MSLNVLVDTSVWSLALRRKPRDLAPAEAAIATELSELVTAGRARLIGIVRQELLSGIKTPEQYERLRKTLRAYPDEPVNVADFEAAAKANTDCRARGIPGSAVNFLICAMAMRREWAIFTTDLDFRRYARVLSLRLHAAPAARREQADVVLE